MSSLKSSVRYVQLKNLKIFNDQIFIKFDCSYASLPHYMALTDNGCVYSWGKNSDGQLGNGNENDCDTPTLINSLSEEFIIDICCGDWHSLVLSRNGDVFAFGDNSDGQCGNGSETNQLTPFKINISSKVTAISCGDRHSIALTENGDVFGWGANEFGQLGIKSGWKQLIPMQLNVPKVKQILCSNNHSLMLSIDGHIYYCGYVNDCLSNKIPTQINSSTKFLKIFGIVNRGLCVSLSENNKYFILGNYIVYGRIIIIKDFTETEFTTMEETCEFYEQLMHNKYQYNYKRDFIEYSSLGSGGFGTVFKSISKTDWHMYAIKKISFEPEKSESVLKELEFLSQLKSDFIVNCFNSWIESNYYLDTNRGGNNQNLNINNLSSFDNKTQLLHIQLELCSFTLKEYIDIIIKECIRPDNTLSLIGYYISSELLYEILECVDYLHTQEKPIIHRDLKPENILITNLANNRFVKLSDFGLSTFHHNDDQSHTKYVGTRNYKAPEISFNKYYTTKVDNFSLGVIIQELFQFQIGDTNKNYLQVLKPKMNYLVKSVINLLSPVPEKRPNCDQLLSDNHLWCLSEKHMWRLQDDQFMQILSKSESKPKSLEENFVEYFVYQKWEGNKINPKRGNSAIFSKFLSAIKGNK